MNCDKEIRKWTKYKLERFQKDPVCQKCWPEFEKQLEEMGSTDELKEFNNQEVLVRK